MCQALFIHARKCKMGPDFDREQVPHDLLNTSPDDERFWGRFRVGRAKENIGD